jgi:mRNA interferase MazF
MTTVARPYPTCVPLTFQGKQGQVALDQFRAIDGQRLISKLGRISPKTAAAVSVSGWPLNDDYAHVYGFSRVLLIPEKL